MSQTIETVAHRQQPYVNPPRLIKDPLHGYVLISRLEHRIINDPMFLRLQHVTQQGLAYLTYPSNRTSRYSHSIGAMHVAGLMVLNLLGTETLLREVDRLIRRSHEFRNPSDLQRFLHEDAEPLYAHYRLDLNNFPAIILFQSIRIAALVHDVGHLPFSHALEDVISCHITQGTQDSERYRDFSAAYKSLQRNDLSRATESKGQIPRILTKVHEAIGRSLTVQIFRRVLKGQEQFSQFFGETCMHLALEISRADEESTGLLSCLHNVISGQVDADRLDFIDRDGYASGLGFGAFDRDRIISTLRLHRDRDNDEYRIRPSTLAVSAVEAFFLERYRNHRWLVFHHNVARGDIAIARSLDILLKLWFQSEVQQSQVAAALVALLNRYEISRLWQQFANETDESNEMNFCFCDEPWLHLMLREADQVIRQADRAEDTTDILTLRVCLGMICRREKGSLISLWKRIEEYRRLADAFQTTCNSKRFNKWFSSKTSRSQALRKNGSSIQFLNLTLSERLHDRLEEDKLSTIQELERIITSKLDGGVILLHLSSFTAAKPYELIDSKGDLVKMGELSSLWSHLNEIGENDIRLQAFFIPSKREENKLSLESGKIIDKNEIVNKLGHELAIAIYQLTTGSAFKEKRNDTAAIDHPTRKPNNQTKSTRNHRRKTA